PGNALGAAMISIVGQCLGAGHKDQAKHNAKKLLFLNYAILVVICSVLVIGRHFFVSCYNLSGESAMYAEKLIFAHCIAMVMWPIAFLTPSYFRAIGRATFTMIVSISVMWIFRIGFAYLFILVLKTSVLGIWYAMFLDWVARFIIYIKEFSAD
ncbi:MAG: MATE family efflux transporter, partial [Clostridia bacterium]|nr:MATE family efflux transporter [Clostridia bacterium]